MKLVVLIFRRHQQEKAYILTLANSMVTWIMDISERKTIISSSTLSRPHNVGLDSFVYNVELIMNRVTDMKNEM